MAARAWPKLYVGAVDDYQSLTVNEGFGHFGPGRGKKPLDSGSGNAHLLTGFLLVQVEEIAKAQCLQFIELEEHGLEATWGHPHGDESRMGWESPAAPRFQWPGHARECTRDLP